MIFGANEAGKSTSLRALTGLLFGIDGRTRDSFLHPYAQLRVGATLVTADGARLSLMRRKAIKQTLFALDEDTGLELTGEPLSEDTLSRLLGGLDEGMYRALFGLDLEGLTRGSEALLAGKGEIGQSLFEAAAGLNSLQQLLGRLDREASALFRPKASTSEIHVAIRELDARRKLMRDATVRTSAWDQADRARRQAEERHRKARGILGELREAQRVLSRIAANLPLAAERAAKCVEREALADVPLLPLDAAERRIAVEERLRGARDELREAQGELARLEPLRAALAVREDLLAHAVAIERLQHGAKAWRGAVERLPGIERALDAARAKVAERVAGIAPAAPDLMEQARGLIAAPTLSVRVRALAKENAASYAGGEELAERERAIRATLDRLDRELAAQPEAAPLDALEAAREEASAQGDLAERQARMAGEIADLEAALVREAAALWQGPFEALLAVRVPLAATLREYEAEFRRLEEERRVLRTKDEDLVRDIAERERELRALAAAGEIVTFEEVREGRLRRDEGWGLIRRAYIERRGAEVAPGRDLPSVYEDAVREADRLADLLRADTERAAMYESTRERIAAMQEARAVLNGQREALAGARGELEARWGAIAASLGQPEITPAAALEWGRMHAAWVERHAQWCSARREHAELAEALAMVRAKVDRALGECGLPGLGAGESLGAGLARAKAAVDAARQAATARAALLGQIAREEAALADVVSRRRGLADKVAAWQGRWSEAMGALHLRAEALPAEAEARLDELEALARALDEVARLAREAEAERETRGGFEAELAGLLARVEASMPGRDADQAVALLYNDMIAAREADGARKRMDADIERERARLRKAQAAETSQGEALADLMRRAGAASPDDLPAIEAGAARKRQVAARIAEIEESLVAGTARPLAEVLAEVEGHEMATTAARLADIEAEVQQQEAATESALAASIDANRAFNAIDGGDAAALAQQEAEELIARIGRHAHTYARTRLAQAVVARVVQSYREKHQGPVLRRAGDIYARITLGSFNALVTDYDDDAQVLLGLRPDGARVGIAGMSQGARDQLFLALRIAAIEEHLKQREPIPLVIDDLLVQFDDARAAATLAVLAELARHTQVLFFTHHGHLCDLAESVLEPGSWQRHGLSGALTGNALSGDELT